MGNQRSAYLGCDPGAKGAFCLLVPITKQIAFMPTTAEPEDLIIWFGRIQKQFNLIVTMIENVASIPGASAKSNFEFGRNVGIVNTIPRCVGVSIDLVRPKKWQKFVGVTGKAKDNTIKKDVAQICRRLYPKSEIYGPRGGLLDGRSDALMIAHYASLTYKL